MAQPKQAEKNTLDNQNEFFKYLFTATKKAGKRVKISKIKTTEEYCILNQNIEENCIYVIFKSKENEAIFNFFMWYSIAGGVVVSNIDWLILERDNYHFNTYAQGTNKRLIDNIVKCEDVKCVVCLEECIQLAYCETCLKPLCHLCSRKIDKKECPICRTKKTSSLVIKKDKDIFILEL